jgi:hypothetical protein
MKSKKLLTFLMLASSMAFTGTTFAQTAGADTESSSVSRDGPGGRGPDVFREIRAQEAVNYLEQRYGPMKNWVCDKSRKGGGYALTEIGTGSPSDPNHGYNRIPDRK